MRLLSRPAATLVGTIALVPALLVAQQTPASRITVERLFKTSDFASAPMPSVVWMNDGRSYLDLRPDSAGGTDIVRVDLVTGAVTELADAAQLVDGSGRRIEVESIELSPDETKALLFSNSVRVWRSNTRGVYHVHDFRTHRTTPIVSGPPPLRPPADTAEVPSLAEPLDRPEGVPGYVVDRVKDPELQMFAKFSPDSRQVAFVRGNNLWVTDLATGHSTQLTTDGSPNIINGTTDWVYEEELGLRDAFRWSPDSRRIAYWRFDQSAVPAYPMEDMLPTYPTVETLRYPKAGYPNSRVRIGVIPASGGATRWLEVGGDTGQYLARMDWLGDDSVYVQRLPRKQDRMDLLVVSATSGRGRVVTTDRDSAYVDVEDPVWIEDGQRFLLLSDRSGWRQVYLFDRSGKLLRQVTRDGMDVLAIEGVDERRGELYVQAAAPDPTQRQIYRASLDGTGWERVTTEPGTHNVTIGPGARWLVDSYSTASTPTTAILYELPAMRRARVLEDNAKLMASLAALAVRPPQFFEVPMPDGTLLDAYRIVPADFDSTRHYPVLMYVYGGPASPQVSDAWGGTRYLWHQSLAQQGYVVVCVDNRGAAWRGRDFRKITQYQLGIRESQDQIDAARWLGARPWVDASRIGIWGWSYGGYMTLMTTGRGGDVFKAGLSVAPVTDFRLYDTIYTERFMWLPSENAAGYERSAPQNNMEGLTARLLIVHGTGDDNVHPQNTIQMSQRLIELGKPFYELFYPNRTHSISGGNTSYHLYTMFTKFITENL
ncbi:MAG TPA: S9 family peptidase [Gemmatimonadaceae bacterium]|nr:S9 family peptidase [Gemmatimonadaceae bacterium]